MKTPRFENRYESGVVLLIALIVLVAMSLAGIAMNNALDAGNGIAGNLAFRQSAVAGTDRAISDAVTWINTNATTGALLNDDTAAGYASSVSDTDPDWSNASSWANSFTSASYLDGAGNTLSYRIDRMCSERNTAYNGTSALTGNANACLTVAAPTAAQTGNSMSAGAVQFSGAPQLAFRITARASGPRNAKAVSQAFYVLPQ